MKDDDWAIQNERGNELLAAGDAAAALVCFNCAIQLQPNNAAIYANLSNALSKLNRLEDAIAAVRQGIRVDPSIPILPHNLSLFLQKARRIDEAVDAATEAVRLNPDDAQYRYTLALALESSGDLDAADREFSEALRIIPNFDRAANSRAFMANFNASFDAARLLDLARDWSTRFEHPGNVVHNNDPNPNRRLKIGYVSATFYDQAEAFFVLPLLESHNREQYEIHCFYNGPFHDVATARHQRTVDGWHEIRGMDDDHAVLLIRQLRIDVLVDLTMHMADSRLRLFALKPAPVQMTWLAYPGTTGLQSIDYRITDPVIDPPGEAEFYSEKSIRLPGCWCCYDPLGDIPPRRSNPTPFIRFGSFNNPFKINEPLVRLWGRVLQRVPGSRLAMLSWSAQQREKIRGVLGGMGIAKERIGFSPGLSREKYLRLYNEIDIGLDTLPYNGITTTCDALCMGVPVVTIKGTRASGRAGASLLTAAGLPELIARTEVEFVEIAAKLAQDSARLQHYHNCIRNQVMQSGLMDRKRFAAEMETVYRGTWETWCGQVAGVS